jgi:hypothetical protein
MSRWFPNHVRRIIAILLLLLDLGLEQGSALAFVGMANDEENESVADLCRQDEFWWGRTSAAIDEVAHLIQTNSDCGDGTRRESATHVVSADPVSQAAVVPFTVDTVVTSANASVELASTGVHRQAFDWHWRHGNSYIAQKRDIVLIV